MGAEIQRLMKPGPPWCRGRSLPKRLRPEDLAWGALQAYFAQNESCQSEESDSSALGWLGIRRV